MTRLTRIRDAYIYMTPPIETRLVSDRLLIAAWNFLYQFVIWASWCQFSIQRNKALEVFSCTSEEKNNEFPVLNGMHASTSLKNDSIEDTSGY